MQAVITVPIIMLWNARISQKQKMALMSIFSLTIIVIIVSIVRVALASSPNKNIDTVWLFMWNTIELAVGMFVLFFHFSAHRTDSPLSFSSAIVVSCLASFRQLYVKSRQPRLVAKSASITPLWRRVVLTASRLSKPRDLSSYSEDMSTQKIYRHETAPMPDSTEHIIP